MIARSMDRTRGRVFSSTVLYFGRYPDSSLVYIRFSYAEHLYNVFRYLLFGYNVVISR